MKNLVQGKEQNKIRDENMEIRLLNNMSIYCSGTEQILTWIKEGNSSELGGDRLKCLEKLLPDQSEKEVLKSFSGDKTKLGNAEKFCVSLMALSR